VPCRAPGRSGSDVAWSPVGNPGNAPDPATGFGAVDYSYNIGTYDVTNSQYVAFLNSNVPGGETADPLVLYNSNMSNGTYGGTTYNSGAASGSKYSVMGSNGQNPVNYVTWYDTLRFANWLENHQVAGMTETGAYQLLGGTPTPSNFATITRSATATVFLPSENEWCKAAYYDPGLSSYYRFATGTNTPPTATGPTSAPNSVNSLLFPDGPDNLTAVGAYSGTTSPYGAYDMAGDVYQWNEALINSTVRGVRGGSFSDGNGLLSSLRLAADPTTEFNGFGFRVASVPEPGTGVLAAFAFGLMWALRKRFK
jgi:sulfatase modifying factor 1